MSVVNRIAPLLDRVLVRRILPQAKTTGGILLPESATQRLNQGVVVAAGPGRWNRDGDKRVVMNVKVGQTVLLPEYGGSAIDMGKEQKKGEEYQLFRDEDLLAVLEE